MSIRGTLDMNKSKGKSQSAGKKMEENET